MSELREIEKPAESDAAATPIYRTPIHHPSAWMGGDFTSPADYTSALTGTQLGEIKSAIRWIKAAGLALDDLQREHFELPPLRPVHGEIRRETAHGGGFVTVRRFPVEESSKDELGMIFWGI